MPISYGHWGVGIEVLDMSRFDETKKKNFLYLMHPGIRMMMVYNNKEIRMRIELSIQMCLFK